MTDPTPTPTPAPEPPLPLWMSTAHGWYDEAKTLALGFALGVAAVGWHMVPPPVPPAPAPAPAPAPIPPQPAPPVPQPIPVPVPVPVKHPGTLFLSYIEPVDTTPQASAIRDAAVGTDWKGLDCRWRSYTSGQASLNATGLPAVAPNLPALVIQELPAGVDPDGANLPAAPVVDVIQAPASLDAIMARVKSLRGE